MKNKEFEIWLKDKKELIGRWTVEPNKKTTKAYSMGCFFDPKDEKWKVYSNEERGQFIVYLETDDEGSAYEELQSMVQFEVKNNKGYY